jgi:hypothetical protein
MKMELQVEGQKVEANTAEEWAQVSEEAKVLGGSRS